MGRVGRVRRPTMGAGDSAGAINASFVINDDGLRRLEKRGVEVEAVFAKLAADAAAMAQQNIRDVKAIDTSFMVNTTKARRLGPMLWSIGTAAYYGVFIEYGTRYVPARPWLMPAMSRISAQFSRVLREALRL